MKASRIEFDINKYKNPTHGWFYYLYHGISQNVVLRDFDITPLEASYVGIVDWDWYQNYIEQKDIALTTKALPPKILFCTEFLQHLSQYCYPLDIEPQTIGNLKWYIVFQNVDAPCNFHGSGCTHNYREYFVNCTMHGHKFSWHLPHNHEESCKGYCHLIGFWRD